jgi:ribonuclease D
MIITRPSELADAAGTLRRHGVFALDMEFERERSYWPKLQLVQVAVPDLVAAIDPLALEDLSPLYDLIADPAIEKITHAGRQDAEIFFLKTGKAPAGIYDTQIAAALVGLGEQVGYAVLVQRLLGVRVVKHERVTDWGRRPLSEAQLEYALNDVRHLLQIRDALNADLRELGREAWFREETAFYSDPGLYRHDPDRLYMKVSRWRSLDRRGLGVLRELVGWREEEAMRRDLPRQRVVPDDVLVELAGRRPKRAADLSPLRRLHPKEIERGGEAIVAAVGRGMALPEAELPDPPKPPREDPDASLAADLLSVLLRMRAREIRIAPSYLGTQKDVLELVNWLADKREGPPPRLIEGWRREVVGDDLAEVYEGRVALRVDAEVGRVVVEPSGSGSPRV